MILAFSVPLLPPSVNHVWKRKRNGGMYLSAEAKAFGDAVAMLARPHVTDSWPVPQQRHSYDPPIFYELELTVYVREKSYLRLDADNFSKCAVDSLTKARLITDDRYIKKHTTIMLPVKDAADERTQYVIRVVERPR